ncbi:hypothetical protein [Streptomyces millisiae]|uniref:Uncharacterized protein n=1 Tax=Streptomyces millisiae TaxID=3075542 RepID=A0ABU2LLG2_9ACTN|nr:hypothetical protein [Streptomyces sp. DSM 44918]MDT0318420.1 hypothetical protein [Streptomyces sp. DSM 44918]
MITQGYWGECLTFPRSPASERREIACYHSASFRAPTQAVVWVRVALRMVVSALPPDEAERAYTWLECGQWKAVHDLANGEPVTVTVTGRGLIIAWCLRPARFLLVVPHSTGPLTRGAAYDRYVELAQDRNLAETDPSTSSHAEAGV